MFLHDYVPNAILLSFGPINIYWYGIFTVLGVVAAILTSIKLAKIFDTDKDTVIDLSFWLIICGIVGARLYHVGLEAPYYYQNPAAILQIWRGGLAIHGAIITGLITIWFFARSKSRLFQLASLIAPGLALAQAFGRWGNYFNQELFGLPTDLPWGIPIDLANRPNEFFSNTYFHPTFLYESLGNLMIFMILLVMIRYCRKKKPQLLNYIFMPYLILYSLLRFSLEFIRIDRTPEIGNWRWPQLISLMVIALIAFIAYREYHTKKQPIS